MLEGWAREGLTDKQIADKMRIHVATLYDYKNKYPDISETLKKGKEVVDFEVENALYKKTQGYNVSVLKNIKVKNIQYDPKTGRKISEIEEVKEVFDEVHIPADTAAQIYWLKCRKPKKWLEQKNINSSEKEKGTVIIDDLPEVK